MRYDVKFGKPVLLPAAVGVWIDRPGGPGTAWDIAVRNPRNGDPHVTGSVTPL